MFCTACGRQIIDVARFCNFCGTPVPGSAPMPVPNAVSAPTVSPAPEAAAVSDIPQSEMPESDVFAPDTQEIETVPAPETSETYEENAFAKSGQPNTAVNSFSAADASAYPMPSVIPQSGGGIAGMPYTPLGSPNAAAVNTVKQKPVRERKYTFGHIMICLAAVAVMAITAGVFAGLYFSVV